VLRHVRRAIFARHCHPWSAWTRWASAPLILVSAVTSAAALSTVIAARRHRLRPALTAVAVQMALTLLYWRQMVRYFDRNQQ
jgi:hypothetical protein